jgi:hypothetical protein
MKFYLKYDRPVGGGQTLESTVFDVASMREAVAVIVLNNYPEQATLYKAFEDEEVGRTAKQTGMSLLTFAARPISVVHNGFGLQLAMATDAPPPGTKKSSLRARLFGLST